MKKWIITGAVILVAVTVLVSCITVFANNDKKMNDCKEKTGYCQMESSCDESCMKNGECSCQGDCSKDIENCPKMQQNGCECPRFGSSQMPGKKGKCGRQNSCRKQ